MASDSALVHRDKRTLPKGCASCHDSHGLEGTGMLPEAGEAFCFKCHGSRSRQLKSQQEGRLARGVSLPDLEAEFRKRSRHPIELSGQHVRFEEMIPRGGRHAECGDCHNHHRSGIPTVSNGTAKRAGLDPLVYEYEVCFRCHTSASGALRDVRQEFLRTNRSSHPVLEPRATGMSGLLAPWRSGDQMNCTDCHGNSDKNGPKGPHGSDFSPLLKSRYDTSDGGETFARYQLCYECHSRETLFLNSKFPQHMQHVRQDRESCSTCHNAHGSSRNRALIDFARARQNGKVQATKSGRLDFVSSIPGRGQCWVSCHNKEHEGTKY